MIRITHKGDFSKTEKFLEKLKHGDMYKRLDACCRDGVIALERATPVDSGKTASSWSYEIRMTGGGVVIYWTNENIVNGFNVAMGLQYGHGTGTGGYVEGTDYINPAMKPVFDKIAEDVWREVTSS